MFRRISRKVQHLELDVIFFFRNKRAGFFYKSVSHNEMCYCWKITEGNCQTVTVKRICTAMISWGFSLNYPALQNSTDATHYCLDWTSFYMWRSNYLVLGFTWLSYPWLSSYFDLVCFSSLLHHSALSHACSRTCLCHLLLSDTVFLLEMVDNGMEQNMPGAEGAPCPCK